MFAYRLADDAAGAGWAVVTDRFLGLLGPEAEASLAAELYRLLDRPDTRMPAVLDALAAHAELGRVAVIEVLETGDRVFSVAVRGDVAVEMGGVASTRISGPSASNWISSEARGVGFLRLALGAGAEGDGAPLPIRRGVVRTRSIAVDPESPAGGVLSAAVDAAAPTTQIPVQRVLDRGAAPAGPVRRTGRPRVTLPAAASVAELRVDAPPAAPPESTAPEPAPAPAAAAAPAVTPTPAVVYLLPDGREVDGSVPVVFGRRPWAGPGEGPTVHVVAPSPNREISAVHLELAVVDGEVRARDLDSTNGTLVLAPQRPPRLLRQGGTTTVGSGDILDLGEAFRVVVSARN